MVCRVRRHKSSEVLERGYSFPHTSVVNNSNTVWYMMICFRKMWSTWLQSTMAARHGTFRSTWLQWTIAVSHGMFRSTWLQWTIAVRRGMFRSTWLQWTIAVRHGMFRSTWLQWTIAVRHGMYRSTWLQWTIAVRHGMFRSTWLQWTMAPRHGMCRCRVQYIYISAKRLLTSRNSELDFTVRLKLSSPPLNYRN